jgi:hypothetical protein
MPVSHTLLTGVVDEATFDRLFERANALKWGLRPEAFSDALSRSVATRFGASGANVGEIETHLESLHLEDLALACACAERKVAAWAYFLECFRPATRTAALAIAGEGGERLADSLYAELYGHEERLHPTRSLLEEYGGRSRLASWLRAVLSQRFVDRATAEGRPGLVSTPGAENWSAPGEPCPPVELLAAWSDQSLASLETSEEARLQGESATVERHLRACTRCNSIMDSLVRSQPAVLYLHPRQRANGWWWRLAKVLHLVR